MRPSSRRKSQNVVPVGSLKKTVAYLGALTKKEKAETEIEIQANKECAYIKKRKFLSKYL